MNDILMHLTVLMENMDIAITENLNIVILHISERDIKPYKDLSL